MYLNQPINQSKHLIQHCHVLLLAPTQLEILFSQPRGINGHGAMQWIWVETKGAQNTMYVVLHFDEKIPIHCTFVHLCIGAFVHWCVGVDHFSVIKQLVKWIL